MLAASGMEAFRAETPCGSDSKRIIDSLSIQVRVRVAGEKSSAALRPLRPIDRPVGFFSGIAALDRFALLVLGERRA
jgi:hypothetical protein